MSLHYLEKCGTGSRTLSWLLTRHMYARLQPGKVTVVCDNPDRMMPAVKREWISLSKKVLRERSATLDATRLLELSVILADMQNMHFSAKPTLEAPEADTAFMTAQQATDFPPGYDSHTVYLTAELTEIERAQITRYLAPGVVIVDVLDIKA